MTSMGLTNFSCIIVICVLTLKVTAQLLPCPTADCSPHCTPVLGADGCTTCMCTVNDSATACKNFKCPDKSECFVDMERCKVDSKDCAPQCLIKMNCPSVNCQPECIKGGPDGCPICDCKL